MLKLQILQSTLARPRLAQGVSGGIEALTALPWGMAVVQSNRRPSSEPRPRGRGQRACSACVLSSRPADSRFGDGGIRWGTPRFNSTGAMQMPFLLKRPIWS